MLHGKGAAQAKAERPKETCVLGKGKKGSTTGQTDKGCLFPADAWPP